MKWKGKEESLWLTIMVGFVVWQLMGAREGHMSVGGGSIYMTHYYNQI